MVTAGMVGSKFTPGRLDKVHHQMISAHSATPFLLLHFTYRSVSLTTYQRCLLFSACSSPSLQRQPPVLAYTQPACLPS